MNKRSPLVKNLCPGLMERGKIKIGMKGAVRQGANSTYQMPVKLDYFLVTTLARGDDGNFLKDLEIHKLIGDKPKEIPIRLLFDDIGQNFQSRYACYYGKTLFCSGDGEYADQQKSAQDLTRIEVHCPCYRQDPTFKGDDGKGSGKCKLNGTLSCIIDEAGGVGGVWKFRTTGFNSTGGIMSSLALIKSLTGGILAGIPLKMVTAPKVATNPTDGKSVTIQVVSVIFAGTVSDLHHGALKIAQENADFRARIANVEKEVQKLLSIDSELVDQAGDITDEFYTVEEPAAPPATLAAPMAAPAAQVPQTAEPATLAPAAAQIPEARPAAQVEDPAKRSSRGRPKKDPANVPPTHSAPPAAPESHPAPLAAAPVAPAPSSAPAASSAQDPVAEENFDLFS